MGFLNIFSQTSYPFIFSHFQRTEMFNSDFLSPFAVKKDYQNSPASHRILSDSFLSELYSKIPKLRHTQISAEDFHDLIRDFFSFREVEDLLIICIKYLKWEGLHDISESLHPEIVLPIDANNDVISKKIKNILGRKTYFTACLECNRFLPTFHAPGSTCYSCLEINHGLIF